MGRSVFSDRNSSVCRADLYIQVGIADGVSDLFIGASRREHGKAAREWNHSRSGKSRRNGHHVALGNSAVNMALRESLLKNSCLGRSRKIRVQNHQVVVLLSKLHQSVSVALPGGDFLYF